MMSSQPVLNGYLVSRSSKPGVKPNHPQPPSWGVSKFSEGESSLSVLKFKSWNGFDPFSTLTGVVFFP